MRLSITLEDRTMHLVAPGEGKVGDQPVWQLLIDGIDKGWSEDGVALVKKDASLPSILNRIESLLYGNISSSLIDRMWAGEIKPKIEEFYGQYLRSQDDVPAPQNDS